MLEVRKPKNETVIWPAQDLLWLAFRFTYLESSPAKIGFVLRPDLRARNHHLTQRHSPWAGPPPAQQPIRGHQNKHPVR